jgi:hypothetical protein
MHLHRTHSGKGHANPSPEQQADKPTRKQPHLSSPQQSEYPVPDAGFKPEKTRAEVRAELEQAYKEGQLAQQQHDGQDPVYSSGSRSRAEVKAELAADREAEKNRRQNPVDNTYFG